jgi:antitoxin ChpS
MQDNPCNDGCGGRFMEVVLKKMGNITALVMPSSILNALRIGAWQRFSLEITSDRKILLTPKHRYVLTDLIAQCDPNALPPADLGPWDESVGAGNEVL